MSADELEQFVQVDATGQSGADQPIDVGPTASREDKIGFLAHILTGVPFLQRYDVAGLGFIEFATLSASELDRLRKFTYTSTTAPARKERLRALMAVACVNRFEIDGRLVPGVIDRVWDSCAAYDDFVNQLPVGLLHVIESQYLDFSRLLAALISKVTDRSFWPTP